MDRKTQRKPRKIAVKAILAILELLDEDDRLAVVAVVFREMSRRNPKAEPRKTAEVLISTAEMDEAHFRAVYYGE
jgi:hypothetical protein